MKTLPVTHILWTPCWRIIPGRFPPIQVFERVTDSNDLDAIIELEALTNPRIRDAVGDIQLVPPQDRVTGPGSSVIMAAFTHLNRDGSRFSDGSFGVFYAAMDLETAIAETRYHRERFLRATNEPAMEIDMRVYCVDLDAELHDVRQSVSGYGDIYHSTDYSAGQALARTLRQANANGIVYTSVRRREGECAAVFRPRLLSNARQERHLCYLWNGTGIDQIYTKQGLWAVN